jgi:hypothetical protein
VKRHPLFAHHGPVIEMSTHRDSRCLLARVHDAQCRTSGGRGYSWASAIPNVTSAPVGSTPASSLAGIRKTRPGDADEGRASCR